jgi:hypothetical protein
VPFPCRIGQAFSPYGRVALPDGDRWVATASDGELDPPPRPCGLVVARARGARRHDGAHVSTL